MTSAVAVRTEGVGAGGRRRVSRALAVARRTLRSVARRTFARELLVFLGFCMLTAVMTWPWVLHLRDAVTDRGDPYMIAWTLWWDYHQTFHNPLHLFDANVFYPYHYTLAFSENDYGLSLLFFPLFALGVRTLTVNTVATFLGFAFCGYGAFRLTRTLAGSSGAAWVAGIGFAFVPYRFQVLPHLHYLFAGWIPLLLEALILFARRRSWRRAAWLGAAFLMNGLTCVSWFLMTSVPLALTVVLLFARRPALLRDRDFWVRGAVAVGVAMLALLPFLIPYYIVSVKYGLRWQPWEFELNSPSPIHWLAAEGRNKFWHDFGAKIPGGHKLFPGMLMPLLALVALRVGACLRAPSESTRGASASKGLRRLVVALDALIVLALVVAALARGYEDITYRVFGRQVLRLGLRSVNHALAFAFVALCVRLALTLPSLIRRARHWKESARARRLHKVAEPRNEVSEPRASEGEAIGVALVWTTWGFLASLGANFVVNRWLHDYVLPFQSLRLPSRWSMICYAGLAVLAGLGASRLATRAARLVPRLSGARLAKRMSGARLVTRMSEAQPVTGARVSAFVFVVVAGALLFELHASPLEIQRGEAEPTELALRLKQTPMKGGLVELPSDDIDSRHFYMLRAADHERPLVNATASFVSPLTDEINRVTGKGPIPSSFIGLLENIPTSYLVVHNERMTPKQAADYETFLARSLASGRLRFVKRFDGGADLYAVTKNEPEARTEAPLPFVPAMHDWAGQIEEDPLNLVAEHRDWSLMLYRLHLAASGSMPRYEEFMRDARALGRDVELNTVEGDEQQQLEENLRALAEEITSRPAFIEKYERLDDARYVARLLSNAGLGADASMRDSLVSDLASHKRTRAGVLLKIAADADFSAREQDRAEVLLRYFAFFRRNPGDPPDRDMSGFNFWVRDQQHSRDPARLSAAFKDSIEYGRLKSK